MNVGIIGCGAIANIIASRIVPEDNNIPCHFHFSYHIAEYYSECIQNNKPYSDSIIGERSARSCARTYRSSSCTDSYLYSH